MQTCITGLKYSTYHMYVGRVLSGKDTHSLYGHLSTYVPFDKILDVMAIQSNLHHFTLFIFVNLVHRKLDLVSCSHLYCM